MYGLNKDDNARDAAGKRGYGEDAGTAMADSTAAVVLIAADFGKTFTCILDGAAKAITLPVSVSKSDIGKQIKIYQAANLVGSGVITLSCGTGNSMSGNSCFVGQAVSVFRPAAALNNTVVITGAATNSAFGAGSTILAEVTSAGKYRIEILAQPLGAGNDAIAVSTV